MTVEQIKPEDEATEPVETATPDLEQTEPETPEPTEDPEPEPETFPREYVQKLRDESAKYRQRAAKTDELAHRLHAALVTATGRLADPTDLPYDEAHLDDPDDLERAISDLLSRKPHLASRRVAGDVGQGASGGTGGVSLAGLLRAGAA
ncbi:hypothetical protein [Isoptericola cucumis]|uniref:Uncharacterized protein n=1 Tax=Isoptericola cucumis TaxID=1776856 RepID=A0ABQ2B710_9MICO|nr:hypothetical protein [Isoptericola cucumis]GGI07004.1 hypothetical protein GCM10007368_13990 [Isoptericola cucumis]